MTEEAILKGCLNNNAAAQRELYNKYSSKMLAVCYRYGHNREDAEDMLQEGFIKVFLQIHTFENRGAFEGWIRRIFVNTAIEQFRKKNYLKPLTEVEENTVEGKYLSVLDTLAEKDIIQLVQQLSPGYRTVFNMYVIEGYTHKQISEILGISEGTSKSQLSRAKLILQDLVKTFIEKRRKTT